MSITRLIAFCFVLLCPIYNHAIAKQQAKETVRKTTFAIAFANTMKNEGGYANDKSDKGGETYCGISRKNFPRWIGWPIIDKRKLKHNEKLPELDKLVQDFYRTNVWNKLRGDEIVDQQFAIMLFDMAVNMGVKTEIKMAQQSLGVAESGIMDDATLNAINQ